MTKVIHIDYCTPRTKKEKQVFGQSIIKEDLANIFINVHKNRQGMVLIDTFFHEMAHVFIAFHGESKQMTQAEEEKLARLVGGLCAVALK